MSGIGAPEIILVALLAMSFGVHVAKHGEPRDPYSAGWACVSIAITMGLLWWGGFFA